MNYGNTIQAESCFLTTGLSSDARSAAANGDSIDRQDLPATPYEAGLLIVEVEGFTGSPTDQELAFVVEHSDDDTTFEQLSGAGLIESDSLVFDGAGIKTLAFRAASLKRYFRARLDSVDFTGGTSPKAKIRALFALSEPRQY